MPLSTDFQLTIISVVVSALASGLLGVLISNWYYQRSEIRRQKLRILRQLLGNRNDLQGQAFTEAFNVLFVVFHDSSEVKQAIRHVHEVIIGNRGQEVVNQGLLELFKAMCKNLGIKTEPLNDTYFIQAYNVRPARQPQAPQSNRSNNSM
jgi:hypothetical protein